MKEIEELATLTKQWLLYDQVLGVLYWDMEVMMPPKGSAARSEQLSFLAVKKHEAVTNPRIGQLISTLENTTLSEVDAAMVREAKRTYERATKVPAALVQAMTEHDATTTLVWREAKEKNDFSLFAPALERTIALKREYAAHIDKYADPYQVLVHDFEQDLAVEQIEKEFAKLRESLVPLIKKISRAKQPPVFKEPVIPQQSAEVLSKEIMRVFGMDMEFSRLDVTPHPFSFWVGDARITTNYRNFWYPITSTAHEAGHALYELGVKRDLPGPLGQVTSLILHESQSRFWENHVFSNRSFLEFFVPLLNKTYSMHFTVDELYRELNRSEPSLIRTEADEVTYSMHVILRFEIESKLIRGEIAVRDVPRVWNEKMHQLLGVAPKTDAEGCLQDVHWSQGGFGYFPTYVLGSALAAMWWEAVQKAVPDVDKQLARGETKHVLVWLREHVHQYGAIYPMNELVKKATGKLFSVDAYVKYLTEKYSALYAL
jgi:carboxypeptidase Taq